MVEFRDPLSKKCQVKYKSKKGYTQEKAEKKQKTTNDIHLLKYVLIAGTAD